jgi:hypothetical protein
MFEYAEEYEPLLKEVRQVAAQTVKARAREIEESDQFYAKITQIYEGTNQIQRFVVAEQLIKEFMEK